MKSSPKNFDVFEFKEDCEPDTGASPNFSSKFNSENGTCLAKEMGDLPCTGGFHKDYNGHSCNDALSDSLLFGTGGPGFIKISSSNDHLPFGPKSYERHQQVTLSSDGQLNCALRESNACDEADDLIPDADNTPSQSSSSTSSYIPGEDVVMEGHDSLLDGCFSLVQKMGDRKVAVVSPDYIVYRGRYIATGSMLIFSSKSMEVKYYNSDGDQKISRLEWEVEDILDIKSQWCERLDIAVLKLRVLSNDAKDVSVPEELQFAVREFDWPVKQEEIMSLDLRYKAIWDVVVNAETGVDEKVLAGMIEERILKRKHFPSFNEPFEEVVYPKGDSDAVSISKRDVDMLQPDTFVNDTIIDFYIKYLKNQMQPEERNRFHFFNSFFFRKLIDLDKEPLSAFEGRSAFQRVRKWTRKVNLFEKDFVFIPVNYSYHWSLIVICHPGEIAKVQDEDVEKTLKVPCILHMDSMQGNHIGLKHLVQSYLWEEWKERNKDASEDVSPIFQNLRFVELQLPQQPNPYDCGLFLLHYAECFLKEAPVNFSPFRITNCSEFLNPDWFPIWEPCVKRVEIQRLIYEILEGENHPAACSSKPCSLDDPSSNAVETDMEFISNKFSSLKDIHGNISGSQVGDGIEITLLQTTSSQNGDDSSLVLREFLQAGASAGQFLDGQYQKFDQAAPFDAMGHMEDDLETCGQYVFSQSNIDASSHGFPYLSDGLGADTHVAEEHDDFKECQETLICGSGGSSELMVPENVSFDKNLIFEENLRQPSSDLAENLISAPHEMLDIVNSVPCHDILNSHGSADDDLFASKLSELSSQQSYDAPENGYITCDDEVVCETSASESEEQLVSTIVAENMGLETDGKLDIASLGNDLSENNLVPESDEKIVAKRAGDVLVPESGEQQPTKRPRLEGEVIKTAM